MKMVRSGFAILCDGKSLNINLELQSNTKQELPKYGENVVLIYGGGSIKKNGIYDDVIRILN